MHIANWRTKQGWACAVYELLSNEEYEIITIYKCHLVNFWTARSWASRILYFSKKMVSGLRLQQGRMKVIYDSFAKYVLGAKMIAEQEQLSSYFSAAFTEKIYCKWLKHHQMLRHHFPFPLLSFITWLHQHDYATNCDNWSWRKNQSM